MPFIPHTEGDIASMLETIGAPSIDTLFDEIPENLKIAALQHVPEAINEMTLMRLSAERAARDAGRLCFIGAGAYDHHVPAAVWDVATRGEFMTAYTPYQAEASQGTLQLIYEYQSMMCNLTAMDVSNASLYDGASALAEAVLMAVRANRKSNSRKVLVLGTVHPFYRKCVESIVDGQGISLEVVPFDRTALTTPLSALAPYAEQDFAGLVIPLPNFFGGMEDVHAFTDWAHARQQLVIAVVNPMALAVYSPPGEWGETGADIAVGEGQSLGIPLASGGPYYGFICCRQEWVRQMPGRIIGRTVDLEGKPGFVLTLQAREQHIRRSKATSNICTNQGLAVTASTIYMSLMGADGLERVASASHAGARALREKLRALPGVEIVGSEAIFHEFVIRLPRSATEVLDRMDADGVLGGYPLGEHDAEMANCALVCVTETRTAADLDAYVAALTRACA